MARLLMVRHCESSGPDADAPLTAHGLAQARALASYLTPFAPDAIICSPFRRARQSIKPLAETRSLTVEIDERLVERTLAGEAVDDWRGALRRSFVDLDHRLPGGESSRDAQIRGRGAIEAYLAREHRLPVVATHGNLMALTLSTIDPTFGFAGWESLSNPDVYVIEIENGRWSFERLWKP